MRSNGIVKAGVKFRQAELEGECDRPGCEELPPAVVEETRDTE